MRTCPEAVTLDDRGDPRNAAGQIRNCWPGEAKCFCDRDNDCYALSGYRACTPVTATASTGSTAVRATTSTAPRDAGVTDSGARDAGSTATDSGARDAGSTTATDSGARDAGATPPPADAGSTTTPPPASAQTPSNGLRAFPGAEGWGASATGGRGGRVIYVTNLNTSGPGSFQDALDQTGRRYILFKVSGVINSDVHVSSGDVTIAGQTSPSGITVRGFDTTEEPYCDQQCGPNARGISNIVARHIRSRPANGSFPDGLRMRYVRNAIIDHFSMGNAEDEAVEISYTNNLTIQDSILAETLGGHAQYGGMLINYTNPRAGYALDQLSLVRNTWNRLQGRFPEFSRESGSDAVGTTMRVELVNNLIWDQRYFIDVNPTNISGSTAGSNIFYQMNWIGNQSWAPSSNRFGMIWIQPSGTGTSAYFNDNRSNLWASRGDWDLNYCCNDYSGGAGSRPSWGRTSPHAFPTTTAMSASQVRAHAAANGGAFPRDPMDTRLMGFVASGTIDSRASNTNPANDALRTPTTGTAPTDSDNDGMPNAWETAHGLNPNVADHNGTNLSMSMTGVAGYTNLECYLNELSAIRVRDNR
ncbi:MAG: hypothetical protein R3A52_09665 [Polyangiales bacterium]